MTAPMDRVEKVLPIALALVGAVRESTDDIAKALHLAEVDPVAVIVALAALVPDDRSATELLEWYYGPRREALAEHRARARSRRAVAQHGTRSGFMRHKDNGTEVCEPCRVAEQAYQAQRHVKRKAVAVAEQLRQEVA